VVGAALDASDVFQLGDVHWACRNVGVVCKAKDTLVAAESTPAVHLAIVGQGERTAVAGSDFDPSRAFGNLDGGEIDLCGRGLDRVHAGVIVVRVRVLSIDVFDPTVPGGIAAERALVVDTPCQDLVVVRQSNIVHTACNNLHNSHLLRVEVGIQTRTLDVDALLVSAKTKLTSSALAEDKDLQAVGGRLVDHRALDKSLDLLHRGCCRIVVGLALGASLCGSCSLCLLCSGLGSNLFRGSSCSNM
jgi:hypothetical protein